MIIVTRIYFLFSMHKHFKFVFFCNFHTDVSFLFQCNNPQTKEPKLKSAVRIVKEWPDYDNEIRRLQERVAAGKNRIIKFR